MDDRTAEIVKELGEELQRLADDIGQLEGKVRERADWRSYFARKPWTILSLALAGGFLVSGLLPFKSH